MIELVDIKDISGNIRFSTPVNEGSKRKFLLMKEDYITLKFSLDSPIYFQLGDGVDNELGIFELIDLYKPAYNTNTGGYDYELRLDAYYWKWKNKKFFYTPQTTGREASWNLTASLDKHLDVFLDNLKALGYKFREDDFIYEIDDTVENASKLVSYDNVNLIDALTQMAETWECEWWIENHKIRFGRCEYSSPIDFKAGDLTDTENANVNSMQRSDSQTTYAIRVYAFGSTRNIPASYRKSLIFDVKEVKGRDISDTARPLDVKFFPNSVSFKEEYHVEENLHGSYLFDVPEREYDSLIALSAHGGVYQVISNGITLSVDCWTFSGPMEGALRPMPGAAKSPLLPGNYVFKASFIYLSDGIQKEVPIGNQTVYIGENQQSEYSVTFSVPDKLEIDKNVSDLQIRTYISAPSYGFGQGYLHSFTQYSIDLINGSSAETSVTFLSGVNKGKTFRAAYNPDLYKGDDANFIRLLEDVTASLGDRYTINNIIKGKVPDNYFSKDDKELTLNGVVQKRLMLPDGIPYVDAYRYSPTGERIDIGDERYDNPDNVEIPEEEAIEEIIILEDEYPKYNGSIFSIIHEEKEEIDEETNKPTGNKYLIYTFKDTGLKNFTKDFLLEELRLIFQTGKLAGLDFALTLIKSDSTGTTFEIVRNEDYGRYLPDDVLFPQAAHTEDGKPIPADTYVLYGFDTAFISEQMLPDAEQELYQKTKERVKKSMIDPSTYECEMDCEYIYNDGNLRTFEVGAKVNLINKAYFPTGRQSRIIGFEWPLDIPYDHPIYTVGETAAYSRIGEIESKLDFLTFKGQSYSGSIVGGGGASVYVIGVNDKTLPSDKNVFSSKKSLETFLRKDQEDKTNHLLELLGGTVTDNIESQDFVSGSLGTGFILKRDPKTGRSYAEIDELYVRMKAIFESLTIKELRSVGGEILLTLAGIECTKVELIDYEQLYDSDGARLVDSEGNYLFGSLGSPSYYRCFFTADDGSKAIINQFAVGDFAQCRQFDIRPGIYEDVSNRYYWRYVAAVGDNYIDLSIDDCMEGSDVPQAGDKIIQLGNRTDVSRQNAILLSAYGLTAPTIQMLQGIDSYSLDGKAVKEEGFDQDTQQFYSKIYGRSYVGARDRSSYLEYIPDKGVMARCTMTGISDDGQSVYEFRPDGTCFFGVTDPVTGEQTGIIQGVNCMVAGVRRSGIFAVVNDEVVFELDPISRKYKFSGEVDATNGSIGGWTISDDGISSEEIEQSGGGVTGNNRTILKKNGTISGNLLNVSLNSGCIRYALYDDPILEWSERSLKSHSIFATPFELISGIMQPGGTATGGYTSYFTSNMYRTNCLIVEPSYSPRFEDVVINGFNSNSPVYYRLPANLDDFSGVTFRIFNPEFRTHDWKPCTAVLVYNIDLDDLTYWRDLNGKTNFLGNYTGGMLSIPPGKMAVITGVRSQISGGVFGEDRLKWYVETAP